MNDRELREFGDKLRPAMPSLQHAELNRDLWPELAQKMHEPDMRVSWVDCALAAFAAAALVFFPGIIPALLYHL